MYCRFMGRRKSMGFVPYKIYSIKITSKKGFLVVTSREGLMCPYDSFDSLSRNWEFVR